VNGTAFLHGTLFIVMTEDFVPLENQPVQIMNFSNSTGNFDNILFGSEGWVYACTSATVVQQNQTGLAVVFSGCPKTPGPQPKVGGVSTATIVLIIVAVIIVLGVAICAGAAIRKRAQMIAEKKRFKRLDEM